MEALKSFIQKMKAEANKLPDTASNAFFSELKKRNEGLPAIKNTEQLYDGEYTNGNQISPAYTPTTIKIKTAKRQPADRVTLKDTGAFYEGIKSNVNISSKSVVIDSTDSKTTDLKVKYQSGSDEIFGLSTDSKNEVVFVTIPHANQELFNLLFPRI